MNGKSPHSTRLFPLLGPLPKKGHLGAIMGQLGAILGQLEMKRSNLVLKKYWLSGGTNGPTCCSVRSNGSYKMPNGASMDQGRVPTGELGQLRVLIGQLRPLIAQLRAIICKWGASLSQWPIMAQMRHLEALIS